VFGVGTYATPDRARRELRKAARVADGDHALGAAARDPARVIGPRAQQVAGRPRHFLASRRDRTHVGLLAEPRTDREGAEATRVDALRDDDCVQVKATVVVAKLREHDEVDTLARGTARGLTQPFNDAPERAQGFRRRHVTPTDRDRRQVGDATVAAKLLDALDDPHEVPTTMNLRAGSAAVRRRDTGLVGANATEPMVGRCGVFSSPIQHRTIRARWRGRGESLQQCS
jgi:hypothetical protein